MEAALIFLASLKPDPMTAAAVMLLLAGGLAVAWPVLAGGSSRADLKRRLKVDAALQAEARKEDAPKRPTSAVREKALKTAQEFYARSDPENVARLRMKLIQAGYMDPRAVGMFFVIRFIGFAVFAIGALLAGAWWGTNSGFSRWAFVIMAGAGGYFLPGLLLVQKVRTMMREYRKSSSR